ncbi:hypothetical protein HOA55_04380 [archaeon]|jgi:hypothetical protein|nr:hypothetical protein [archaeon]MBT3577963.1 hypothetical protein [archaeon]MBT6820566.1 hypothetical protein [archaeon]MBT6955935.1 hypothetical protein [archaeon]MBT7025817.1 hypothetical protein [archaeon]
MRKTVMFLVSLVIVLFSVSSFLGMVDARRLSEAGYDCDGGSDCASGVCGGDYKCTDVDSEYGYGECGYGSSSDGYAGSEDEENCKKCNEENFINPLKIDLVYGGETYSLDLISGLIKMPIIDVPVYEIVYSVGGREVGKNIIKIDELMAKEKYWVMDEEDEALLNELKSRGESELWINEEDKASLDKWENREDISATVHDKEQRDRTIDDVPQFKKTNKLDGYYFVKKNGFRVDMRYQTDSKIYGKKEILTDVQVWVESDGLHYEKELDYNIRFGEAMSTGYGELTSIKLKSDPCPAKCKEDKECWKDQSKKEDCNKCLEGSCTILDEGSYGCLECGGGEDFFGKYKKDFVDCYTEDKNLEGYCSEKICKEKTCNNVYGRGNYSLCPK